MPAAPRKTARVCPPLGQASCRWAHQGLGVHPYHVPCVGLPAHVPVVFKHSGRIELCPVKLKQGKRGIMGPHAQHPLARVVDHACGLEHQHLNHRANSSSLRCAGHRGVGLMQGVLTHQAQQIHRHRSQYTHQIVRIELAKEQAGETHVRLELRMKRIVCAILRTQGRDLLGRERAGQGGVPALQHIPGQQHLLALFVDGAFSQPVAAARSQHVIAMPELNTVRPQALALAFAKSDPYGIGISCSVLGNSLHGCTAWVPLDDEGDLPLQGCGKSIHIQGHAPTGQHTKVHGFVADLHAQYGRVDLIGQVNPRGCMCILALAKGGRPRHSAHNQGTGEEGIFTRAFDGIKVVLTQTQQTEVTLQDVAVGNTRADRDIPRYGKRKPGTAHSVTMKQSSFDLNLNTRRTRKQVFSQQMETVVPWGALVELTAPYYSEGRNGRPLFPLETILRVYFMQQWFSLSDPAMEEAFFDTPQYREFAQLNAFGRLPDESTIFRFRHRLEKYKLADQILSTANEMLEQRGLLIKVHTPWMPPSSQHPAPPRTKPKHETPDAFEPQRVALRHEGPHWRGCRPKRGKGPQAAPNVANRVRFRARTGSGRSKYHQAKNCQVCSMLGGGFFGATLTKSPTI